jgi:hypothetical protein
MRRCIASLLLLASLCIARPAHAQSEMFKLATVEDVPSRIDIGYEGGRGLDFDRGFTQLNLFVPFYQYEELVFFSDARTIFFDREGMKNLDLGVGARAFVPMLDRVVGLNAYLDNYDSGEFTYRQLSVGYELLGDYFDFRGNFYLPLGDNRKGTSIVDVSGFQGFNLITDRVKSLEVSQRGLDVEMGITLPSPETVVARAAVGYYNYQGQGAEQIQGIRGRFTASFLDAITVEAVVENDKVFHTTAYGGIGLRFGGPSSQTESGMVALRDRRADPVVRNPSIVIRPATDLGTAPARQTPSAIPFRIIHVDSFAAPGGNGTFERPFQNLTQAQNGSIPGDIIYVHAGSFLTGTNFTLQNNQRLLGEGVPHVLQTLTGPVTLPGSNNGRSGLPLLQLSTGGFGVNLASNNEVSGLDFRGAMDARGVNGTNSVGFFNIDQNRFSGFTGVASPAGPSGAGIFLFNANGSGLITSNTFSGGNFGIFLGQTASGVSLITGVRDNTFANVSIARLVAAANNGVMGLQYLRNTSSGITGPATITATGSGTILLEPLVGNSPVVTPSGVTNVPANSLGLP